MIANQGEAVIPHGVLEERLLSPLNTHYMAELLRAVITEKTGRSAALSQPTWGKSATMQAYRDIWFAGFAGPLVTGSSVGSILINP